MRGSGPREILPVLRLADTRYLLTRKTGIVPLAISPILDVIRRIPNTAPELDVLAIVRQRRARLKEAAEAGLIVDKGRYIGGRSAAGAVDDAGIVGSGARHLEYSLRSVEYLHSGPTIQESWCLID